MPTFENNYVENVVGTLTSRIPVRQIHLEKNNQSI